MLMPIYIYTLGRYRENTAIKIPSRLMDMLHNIFRTDFVGIIFTFFTHAARSSIVLNEFVPSTNCVLELWNFFYMKRKNRPTALQLAISL